MKKQEWNDEQLEQLLKTMPTISDNRNPQEIYQNISSRVKKRQKRTWIMPSLATAFALLLFFIISPEIIYNFKSSNQNSSQSESISESSADQAQLKMAEDAVKEPPAEAIEENSETTLFDVVEETTSYVVWEEQLVNKTLLTYNVPHSSVLFMVPISVLVDPEGQNPVQLMNDYVSNFNVQIDQSDWGLEPFPTNYFASLSEEKNKDGTKTVKADLPESMNTESFSSAEMDAFFGALQSFRWFTSDYSQIDIYQNGVQNAVIGQTGQTLGSYNLNQDVFSYHYYELSEENRGNSNQNNGFLVPTPTSIVPTPVDLKAALDQMKNEVPLGNELTLKAPIKQDVTVENIIKKGTNIGIVFSSDSNLVNNGEGIMMIEAIMLTAKEFGYETVTFQGDIDHIGKVKFGEAVPVPFAPNPIRLQ